MRKQRKQFSNKSKMLMTQNYLVLLCFLNSLHKISCDTFKVSGGYRLSQNKLAKYVASIRHTDMDNAHFGSGHMCGGVIIGTKLILTAAHCLYPLVTERDSRKSPLSIVVGTTFRTKYSHGITQIFKVADFVLHPLYDYYDLFYDIGLAYTHRSIDIDGVSVGIMNLPKRPPRAGMRCVAAGWGEVYYNGPMSDEIVFIKLHILNEKDCQQDYPGKSENDICATNAQDIAVDTCKGDSGGPLLCNGQLYGVTSRGKSCGKFNQSGLYSNVYNYNEWIKSNDANKIQIVSIQYISLIQFIYFWMFQ